MPEDFQIHDKMFIPGTPNGYANPLSYVMKMRFVRTERIDTSCIMFMLSLNVIYGMHFSREWHYLLSVNYIFTLSISIQMSVSIG